MIGFFFVYHLHEWTKAARSLNESNKAPMNERIGAIKNCLRIIVFTDAATDSSPSSTEQNTRNMLYKCNGSRRRNYGGWQEVFMPDTLHIC